MNFKRIVNQHQLAEAEQIDMSHLARKGSFITPDEERAQRFYIIKNLIPRYRDYLSDHTPTPDDVMSIIEVVYRAMFIYELNSRDYLLRKDIQENNLESSLNDLAKQALESLTELLSIMELPSSDINLQIGLIYIFDLLISSGYMLEVSGIEVRSLRETISLACRNQIPLLVSNIENMSNIDPSLANFIFYVYQMKVKSMVNLSNISAKDNTDLIDYEYNLLDLAEALLDKIPECDTQNRQEIIKTVAFVLKVLANRLEKDSLMTDEVREFVNEKLERSTKFFELVLSIPGAISDEERVQTIILLTSIYMKLGKPEKAYEAQFADPKFLTLVNKYYQKTDPVSRDRTSSLRYAYLSIITDYLSLGIQFSKYTELNGLIYYLELMESWLKQGHEEAKAYKKVIQELRKQFDARVNSES